MKKMNWKGYLILLAEVLVIAAIVTAVIGNRISNYNWERGVESRIELASKGNVDVIDVRREKDVFVLMLYTYGEMTEREWESYQEETYKSVEDAGKGYFTTLLVRPNGDKTRWYTYTIIQCPTSLWLDGIYDSCEVTAPLWAELDKKHTRWANK